MPPQLPCWPPGQSHVHFTKPQDNILTVEVAVSHHHHFEGRAGRVPSCVACPATQDTTGQSNNMHMQGVKWEGACRACYVQGYNLVEKQTRRYVSFACISAMAQTRMHSGTQAVAALVQACELTTPIRLLACITINTAERQQSLWYFLYKALCFRC